VPPLLPLDLGRVRGPAGQDDTGAIALGSRRKLVGPATSCEYFHAFLYVAVFERLNCTKSSFCVFLNVEPREFEMPAVWTVLPAVVEPNPPFIFSFSISNCQAAAKRNHIRACCPISLETPSESRKCAHPEGISAYFQPEARFRPESLACDIYRPCPAVPFIGEAPVIYLTSLVPTIHPLSPAAAFISTSSSFCTAE
jgi:hypothetical protein